MKSYRIVYSFSVGEKSYRIVYSFSEVKSYRIVYSFSWKGE